MKNKILSKRVGRITGLSLVIFISLSISNSVSAQTREINIPEVRYTTLDSYYNTGSEIACTASVYSNGLIDQLCAIYYTIYKDDYTTPINSVGSYGSINYTVRSQGTDYITQTITDGSGYLSVKPLFTAYKAFTLGIFDNYCTNRNRPVMLAMVFDEPGVYKFSAEIQSCTNSGSSTFTNFTVAESAPEGCVSGSHSDRAASTCSNPTSLFAESIFLTICEESSIEFVTGAIEYCPSAEINLVYNIGEFDDEVDLDLLPDWIIPIINQSANTLTLTGNAPAYNPENPSIGFEIRTSSSINPEACPSSSSEQFITILNAQTPIISGENMICEGGTVIFTSDIAATWSSSNLEVATIEQTTPSLEATVTSLNWGTTIITCQINDNDCDISSNPIILNVNEVYEITLAASICDGEIYPFDGSDLDSSGEYTLTTISQYGCDSIVNLNLQVNALSNSEFIVEGESYIWNETEYTESGNYEQIFTDINGCDSIVTLHLTIITDIANHFMTDETINVYPNPVSENLHIDIVIDNNKAYSIILTDITGKVLIKKDNASANNILDFSTISGGIYFISVLSDNKIIFTSMINKE